LLGKFNRILYVETGGLRAPTTTGHDLRRIFSKLWRFIRGERKISGDFKDFYVVSLLLLPFHRLWLINLFNQFLVLLTIRFYSKRYNLTSPIVFFFFPHLHYLCGKLGESLDVYYCIDDYSGLPGVDKFSVKAMDDALTKKANLVFVVCSELLSRKKALNKNVAYSPHGVDALHFDLDQTFDLPEPLANHCGKRHIVLFWGLLAEWIDYDLIEYLLTSHPDKVFVFLGRVSVNINDLLKYDNVVFLGPVNYEELPAYAKYSDVLISPFIINEWSKTINPIKLREYLATGRPVVSTALPEAIAQSDFIRVAYSKEEFSVLLQDALQKRCPLDYSRRREYVREFTWERRVEEISSRIALELGRLNDTSR
jgi:hypothetical protein